MRLRGPRLSLGLGGLHLAGPRVYFGRGRRHVVSHTLTVIVTTGERYEPRRSWSDVDRIEFHPNGPAASYMLVSRGSNVTRADSQEPVAELIAGNEQLLASYRKV